MMRFFWLGMVGLVITARGVLCWVDHLKMTKRAAALLLSGTLVMTGGWGAYYATTHFSSFVWKLMDPYDRYAMANDLIRNVELYEKTKDQILELLGPGDVEGSTPDKLIYWMSPGFMSMADQILAIHCDPETKEVYLVEYYMIT